MSVLPHTPNHKLKLPDSMPVSIDLSSIRRVTLESPPTQPPRCHRCGRTSERLVTRSSNRNGNAGRPYYKCLHCNKFLVFGDYRGNDSTNPKCYCGCSSKLQVTGRSNSVPGRLHYVCRLGLCDFSGPCRDERGLDVVINMDLVGGLSRLFIICLFAPESLGRKVTEGKFDALARLPSLTGRSTTLIAQADFELVGW
ncbi:hypothetical protein F5X98DRAFT_379980 [Xylaria grammica]|nr:hypothetical protein F5X98DRAFT_379980 [Xylaria grammica]